MQAMTLPDDFREFLQLLVEHDVDVDVVVNPEPKNAQRLVDALQAFGFGSVGLSSEDFTRAMTAVLGRAPHEIGIMTFIQGVDFGAAWERRSWGSVDGVRVAFIGKSDLILNKLAVGRPEDLADVARLRALD